MKFENSFKKPQNLKEKELKIFKDQAYATFCVNYVESIKKDLNLKTVETEKDIIFSMDYTKNYIKNKIKSEREEGDISSKLHLDKNGKNIQNNKPLGNLEKENKKSKGEKEKEVSK